MTDRNHLIHLAEKYECKDFINGDPSWFMHQVLEPSQQELMAFIAASLSYGSRKQFMPKIQMILDMSNGDLREWLLSGKYKDCIEASPKCFYRLYTMQMYYDFLKALEKMVRDYGSLRGFVEFLRGDKEKIEAIDVIKSLTQWFKMNGSIGIIPKDATSSCKRICMFLRWMTRKDSPVDLGLWNDLIYTSSLIMPMDVHVVEESIRLGLIQSKSTTMSNAIRLTKILSTIWPEDPTKGDFALFGLGIDNASRQK